MKESLKSLALALLVLTSIVQTGMLWYSSPSNQGNLPKLQHIPTIGHKDFQKEEIHQLAAPSEIMLHHDGEHRRILPGADHQTLIDRLHHARLENPQTIDPSPAEWKKWLDEETGLELRFRHELPVEVIQAFFQGETEIPELDTVHRIWISGEGDNNQVTVWLISDQTQTVVEGTALLQNYDEMLKLADQAAERPLKAFLNGKEGNFDEEDLKRERAIPRFVYLPPNRAAINRWSYNLEQKRQINVEDMKMILFRNPNNVEKTAISNHIDIYTDVDSSRSLRYNEQNNTMVYTNLLNDTEQELPDPREKLNTIISFMNRHSGWTGNYLLNRVETNQDNGASDFFFQLHVKGLPLYGSEPFPKWEEIRLSAQQGVTHYERSLIFFSSRSGQKHPDHLPSGNEVREALKKQNADLSDVRQIYPGYHAVTRENKLELEPVWVVDFYNGKQGFLSVSQTGRDVEWTGAKLKPS